MGKLCGAGEIYHSTGAVPQQILTCVILIIFYWQLLHHHKRFFRTGRCIKAKLFESFGFLDGIGGKEGFYVNGPLVPN